MAIFLLLVHAQDTRCQVTRPLPRVVCDLIVMTGLQAYTSTQTQVTVTGPATPPGLRHSRVFVSLWGIMT